MKVSLTLTLWFAMVNFFFEIDGETNVDYMRSRQGLLVQERLLRTGGHITLTKDEQVVNKTLMRIKRKEIQSAEKDTFLPSSNFINVKTKIEKSEVFKILKKMPKGAALHVHDGSIADVQWLIKNATYRDECYMCISGSNNQLQFTYSSKSPIDPSCQWKNVNLERKLSGSPEIFDNILYKNMTLMNFDFTHNPPTQNEVWKKFQQCFKSVFDLIAYAPVFKDYYTEALNEFYNDNVQYMEIRTVMPPVHELDGRKTYNTEWVAETYKELTTEFMKKHKDYLGAKLIYCSSRDISSTQVMAKLKDAIKLHQKYPETVLGFDLVGQEDTGQPLKHFINELLYPSQQKPKIKIPYFFHAGETDWEASSIDDNLIDAVLLNTTRIGHGYAIMKHPKVRELAFKKHIAIEVNPISNQVLGLVKDLRNHPAADLMAMGYPVVISSDDPTLWGASGLSYDFYEAFMALGGDEADLAFLKQLALDSIRFSGMSDIEKKNALSVWEVKWKTFITEMIKEFHLKE